MENIARLPDLGLELVAGQAGCDNEVRWVHVSEVEDPTPWLRGGELLLTTGMQLDDEHACREYVRRLKAADLSGIGFGVGMRYPDVPQALRAEADRVGMPVIRVPVEAPYISISEAVSKMLSEERYQVIARAFDAQQEFTRAAIAGSTATVVHEVASRLRGWAIHTDGSGRLQSCWPDDAADRLPSLLPDIFRARESSAIIAPSESTVIHALTVDGVPRGYLAVGAERTFGVFERLVLQGAVAILTLESERSASLTNRLRRLQSDTLRTLLRSPQPPYDASRQVTGWGLDLFSLRLCAALVPERIAGELVDDVFAALSERGIAGAACSLPGHDDLAEVAILVDSDEAVEAVVSVANERQGLASLGIGESGTIDRIRQLHRDARSAAQIGRIDRRRITRFDDLPAMHLLLGGENAEAVRSFAERVLQDLAQPVAPGRLADLRATLEAFLTHNGHWSESAAALQIHRHTLRSRIERIAEITGRDPESSYGRMELWLAVLAENARLNDG
jgi:purine catabolism regulator